MEITIGFDMALTFRASRYGLETAHVGVRRDSASAARLAGAVAAPVESFGDEVAETSEIVEFPDPAICGRTRHDPADNRCIRGANLHSPLL
jgi:hypothetical protein